MVMGNWNSVLQAIDMASTKLAKPPADDTGRVTIALPQTLVRIPTEHAPNVQAHAQEEGASEGE
jgi:DASH complex subunit DAD2